MKEIGVGVSEFKEVIEQKLLYVDKTEFIWQLLRHGTGEYFLIRPHGFGKSLLISTLKAIFQGRRELFKGLAIYEKPYDWKQYPIIHLSFGDYNPINNTQEKLNIYLLDKVMSIAEQHSVRLPETKDPSSAFGKLVDALFPKNQVVILVDEYDKPILDNITSPNIKEIQQCLILAEIHLRTCYSQCAKSKEQE